jgi:hypothetical protein
MAHPYENFPYQKAFEARKKELLEELKNKKAAPKKEPEQK